ncbi:hypothetical protein [Flexithrix dorotheae]|uniref:hypothetical protein n=1 Tax=Flexithrix dorotheae TaxID=70993 RepID=UPI00035DC2EE|nr:hypothetical protein [Flexithrix dorotheae]
MKNSNFLKLIVFSFIGILISFNLSAQTSSKTFELRYFTNDPKANGETDFKGETEYLSVEQRVEYLKHYADYASRFFKDQEFNTKVVEDSEVENALSKIKPQPLPEVRKRIPLENWKWLGYKEGQAEERTVELNKWAGKTGLSIEKGVLNFNVDKKLKFEFPSQSWRSTFRWKVKPVSNNEEIVFEFSDKEIVKATTLGFGASGKFFYYTANNEKVETGSYKANEWYNFKLELDFAAFKRGQDLVRYNLYVNDEKIADYIPMQRVVTEGVGYATGFTSIPFVNTFTIKGKKRLQIDDIWGVGYHLTGRETYPYTVETFLDENFEIKPNIADWQKAVYEDSLWQSDKLPIVHGSERHTLEDLYLRKNITVGKFTKAFLNIETLDPGGEIWVNGEVVAVVNNKHPIRLDISNFLKKDEENQLAIKVRSFYIKEGVAEIMPHSSLDMNVGWFAGRMSLDLVADTQIEEVLMYTKSLDATKAVLHAKVNINNQHWVSFRGNAEIKVYPWFPTEAANPVATDEFPIVVGNGLVEFEKDITITNPIPWTSDNPTLYKIHVVLKNSEGKPVDDYVVTTGIRTISQVGGSFRLNGKTSMLNGAQIMGFRGPEENMLKWVRCAPAEWLAKEILMIKKMNGNFLRVHVHGYEFPSSNINDPRLCEMADQLGMMMAWGTPSWVRTGKGWGQIDFEGYPKYMKQVYNHPSIVIWEAANHTQSFKRIDLQESNIFCEKVHNTIYPLDPSRLISLNSYIKHLHFGNDEGTIDQQGNSITPSPAWTGPMVTRGNQDGITGYKANWTNLRKWPNDYFKSFLESKERAYFNFEHEESMGQPNWNLVKGKPWYKLHSYEWEYDEGTIGRKLNLDEWKESQAWQAFSAWESMKKQRWLGYDGFSWCCLHGGANSVTYKKPLIDYQGHAKLAYWTNKMVFQKNIGGSANVDLVYGPEDEIKPIVIHWGDKKSASLTVIVKTKDGKTIAEKQYNNIEIEGERGSVELEAFKPTVPEEGFYIIEYDLK